MELSIRPYSKNSHPAGGILIRSTSVAYWLREIGKLSLSPLEMSIHPIPGTEANTLWGCLVIIHGSFNFQRAEQHEVCQKVSPNLFIAARSVLHPPVTPAEINVLFPTGIYVMHPEFGLAELPEELDVKALISEPVMRSYHVTKPEDAAFIPGQIKSFQVKPIPEEDVLANLEKNIFPKKEDLKEDALSPMEKLRHSFYKLLFTSSKKEGEESGIHTEKKPFWQKIESFVNRFSKGESNIGQNMLQDYEDLERRNQNELEKLLDMLRNNPEEALKYAIPLDEHDSARGGDTGSFTMSKRWQDFSLLGGNRSPGSGSVNMGDGAHLLREQYNATAQKLIKDKEYHKAAFIYLKLLKNPAMAAQTLELGEHYQEAALIYLKNCLDKNKAAQCYEKGKMTEEAITLYKELDANEKVGDLYVSINKRKEANIYYEKVVDGYARNDQYVKASLIYKNKMQNAQGGQSLLLQGWRKNKDALNCLNNYFSNIEDTKTLKREIDAIQKNDLNAGTKNHETFLHAIHQPYKQHPELSEWIREIAYEVIASQTKSNPDIVTEMKLFNKTDKHLLKDTFRFRLGKKL